jgi:hypothetical protein
LSFTGLGKSESNFDCTQLDVADLISAHQFLKEVWGNEIIISPLGGAASILATSRLDEIKL